MWTRLTMSRPHPSFAVLVGCTLTALSLWIITSRVSHGLVDGAAAFTVAAMATGAILGVGFGAMGALTGALGALAILLVLWIPVVLNTLGFALLMTPLFLLYAAAVLVAGLVANWIAVRCR